MTRITARHYLLYGIITTALLAALIFRNRIYLLLFERKTVESVIAGLQKTREQEFLTSFPDLYQIRSVLLIAIKDSRELEVWTSSGATDKPRYRKTYPFMGFSGKLGPKLVEGDGQIPEGIYEIAALNPNSKFHLSIKIAYPNDTDMRLAQGDVRQHLGGDIFIHGKTLSIGCIPLGDKNIEELFYLVASVKTAQTKIIIMPVDFRLGNNDTYRGKTITEREIYAQIRHALR